MKITVSALEKTEILPNNSEMLTNNLMEQYQAELAEAQLTGDVERMNFLEGKIANLQSEVNDTDPTEKEFETEVSEMEEVTDPPKNEIFLGKSQSEWAKEVDSRARDVENARKKIENCQSLLKQRRGFLESDIKNGRSTIDSRSDVKSATQMLENAQKELKWAQEKLESARKEYDRAK